MKKEGLVFLACALGLVLAPACSSSSPAAEPAEAGGASSGSLKGITPGSSGATTETQILCLGDVNCAPGTVCCGNLATTGVVCSTGPSCPLGSVQICMADADCVGGGSCAPVMIMGVTLGTCGLGGSSSSGGGGSSGSSGGGSSGGSDADGGDTGGDAAGDAPGDGSLGVVPDASTG
ncbi:MAG: hypothetical protein ACLP1X_19360 [Polyangiaceae bacterium]